MKSIWRWIILPVIFILTLVVLIEGGGARADQSYPVRPTGGVAHFLFLPFITGQTDIQCTDADRDGYAIEGGVCGPADCDDTDADVNPGAQEMCSNGVDDNCNGDIDAFDMDCMLECTDADNDEYAIEGGVCGLIDCNDGNPAINPGVSEVCGNGLDDNCNGLVDADDPVCPVCTDTDNDEYAVEGGVCGPVDCDDVDPDVNPGAQEVCNNGIDDDCDSYIDALDADCVVRCTDADGDTFYKEGGVCGPVDCDDSNPNVNPDASEVCDNGIDDDCDGRTDADDIECMPNCTDADDDNYAIEGGDCGLVDCDDSNPHVNPGAPELCANSLDEDCDTVIDEDEEGNPCCADADQDWYAPEDPDLGSYCGQVDCDDADPNENPGLQEIVDDRRLDDDCDGCRDMTDYEFWPCTDADGDTYPAEGGWCGEMDCDDSNPGINPGATESCSNGIDDSCDGYTDAEDQDCMTCTDGDGDGYFAEGFECGPKDCVDSGLDGPAINPGAAEACSNGKDDDCDSLSDGSDPYCDASIKNIIVVGWDGTQRDHFRDCYNKLLPECTLGLPNIQALSGGTIFNSTITNGETSTKPGWAQIFSGYNADVTGVYSLENYQPIPIGYTVFEKIEDHFAPDNINTIFVSGKGVNTGGACRGDITYKTSNGKAKPCVEDLGQPWCETKENIDHFELDKYMNGDIGALALALIQENRNRLFFASFIFYDPDTTGHRYGEYSSEYSVQMTEVDDWLGQIISKTVDLGLDERTLIYVTTDHGFDEFKEGDLFFAHLNAPYGFFASNDTGIMRPGDRKDVAPTILEKYGISTGAIGPAPAVDGYSLLHPNPLACIPEGEAYLEYPSAKQCCVGLELINMQIPLGIGCKVPTGGTGDDSGYCTDCGNGSCDAPENRCNCPDDCD